MPRTQLGSLRGRNNSDSARIGRRGDSGYGSQSGPERKTFLAFLCALSPAELISRCNKVSAQRLASLLRAHLIQGEDGDADGCNETRG